jgi:hypothetical protein
MDLGLEATSLAPACQNWLRRNIVFVAGHI